MLLPFALALPWERKLQRVVISVLAACPLPLPLCKPAQLPYMSQTPVSIELRSITLPCKANADDVIEVSSHLCAFGATAHSFKTLSTLESVGELRGFRHTFLPSMGVVLLYFVPQAA